ncbi:N-acetylglucosamine-6-phosphate deacetylase [Corynebacterium tapiri]|uniref:Amidohydrolase family protein n=1 Tax=Corynebacterium tapiri TaxID=1448266 RepID=A0A5C4U245_9CORY|nr:amidohydrolase family protein [Corynebacterium tapiri]TNL96064.1 amidohydrolase family protein [Corynebacterium tapiri]
MIGRIVTPERVIPHGRLVVEDRTIEAVEELDGPAPEGASTFVPGFVDLHNHGGDRGAFPTGSEEDCRRAAAFHLRHGSTTLLASLVSATEEEITRQVRVLRPLVEDATIAGIHLEGPFINACRCGAQAPDRIQPGDPEMFARILEVAEGTVRQMTLAPETDHVDELVRLCVEHNVVVSFGHSDADAETARLAVQRAVEAGATVTATHLFNGMPPVHHRKPGVAAAMLTAAASGQAWAEVIADGVHLADDTVDMVVASAPGHSFAITDAMEAAGMPDGDYRLGPLEVAVVDRVARLVEGGAIAGGTSTLHDQYLRFSSRHGEVAAAKFVATTAAEVLGLSHVGRLEPGAVADVVELAPTGEIRSVIRQGQKVS